MCTKGTRDEVSPGSNTCNNKKKDGLKESFDIALSECGSNEISVSMEGEGLQ